MKDLSEIRCDIDAIDRQIVSLYEQRMGLAAEVAEYKIANHKNVYDKAVSYTHLTLPTKLEV